MSNLQRVLERWETAPIKTATPAEVAQMQHSPEFYAYGSYCWDKQPPCVNGEVGYNDDLQARIVVW